MTQATAAPTSKITVYMTAREIAALDEFRAELRRDGMVVDRGRMVRAALRMALGDPLEWTHEMEGE